jgi:hypothetical protein
MRPPLASLSVTPPTTSSPLGSGSRAETIRSAPLGLSAGSDCWMRTVTGTTVSLTVPTARYPSPWTNISFTASGVHRSARSPQSASASRRTNWWKSANNAKFRRIFLRPYGSPPPPFRKRSGSALYGHARAQCCEYDPYGPSLGPRNGAFIVGGLGDDEILLQAVLQAAGHAVLCSMGSPS